TRSAAVVLVFLGLTGCLANDQDLEEEAAGVKACVAPGDAISSVYTSPACAGTEWAPASLPFGATYQTWDGMGCLIGAPTAVMVRSDRSSDGGCTTVTYAYGQAVRQVERRPPGPGEPF